MAGWTIHVCPKCHTLGTEGAACPNGCTRALSQKEAAELDAKEGDQRPIQCIGVDVVPTQLATIALINVSTDYPIV